MLLLKYCQQIMDGSMKATTVQGETPKPVHVSHRFDEPKQLWGSLSHFDTEASYESAHKHWTTSERNRTSKRYTDKSIIVFAHTLIHRQESKKC
jgi:hypothetical protein